MEHSEAYRLVNQLIDFCKENGLDEFENDLYSLLDAIHEEMDEMTRGDNQG